MFHPDTARTAAIEAQMPLEPALAALQDNIQESFTAINANMEDLEQQLERWEKTVGAAAAAARPQRSPLMGAKATAGGLSASKVFATAGPFKGIGLKSTSPWGLKAGPGKVIGSTAAPANRSAAAGAAGTGSGVSAQVELLYKVVNAQQDTARNLAARITTLAGELERLGVVKTDTEHMGGRTLGKWGEQFDSDSDGGYGSEPGIDEDEYERGTHTPSASGLSGSAVFSGTTPTTGTRLGLPRTTPKSNSAWRTPAVGGHAGSVMSAGTRVFGSALKTPAAAVSGTEGEGQSKLHWVTPGSSGRRAPGSSCSSQQREVRSSSNTATSSSAWQKFAAELSDSAKKSTGGSGRKSRVRTTVATPLPSGHSRSSARRQQQRQDSGVSVMSPPRPPSPLQISAAAAVTPPAAATLATPAAAFSFPGQPQSGEPNAQQQGFSTPAANRLPGKLSFSPAAAAAPKVTPTAATTPAASPNGLFGGLSPVTGDTPATAAATGSKGSSTAAFNFFSANPLFDKSPGGVPPSPLAAVPPPALQLGTGAASTGSGTASAAKPPTAAGKAKGSQPPEPPMIALMQAASLEKKVSESCWGCWPRWKKHCWVTNSGGSVLCSVQRPHWSMGDNSTYWSPSGWQVVVAAP